jgi:hypothetical protein
VGKGIKAVKRRAIVPIIVFLCAALHLGAEPCAYSLRSERCAGPEVTGNYAAPYLYSPDTRCWYPDPMYYVAKDALRRWHARQERCRPIMLEKTGPAKQYRPTIEK